MDRQLSTRESQAIRTIQIIVGAMILGIVVFAIVGLALGGVAQGQSVAPPGGGQAGGLSQPNLLRLIWLVMVAGMLPAGVLLRRMQSGQAVRSVADAEAIDREALLPVYMTMTIISAAMAEGAALFGCVMLLLSGSPMDLIFIALPLLVMLWLFPTPGKWRGFVERVERERSLRRAA